MWKLLFYKEFHLSWKNILRAFPYLIYWLYLEFALLTCTLPFVYTLNSPAKDLSFRFLRFGYLVQIQGTKGAAISLMLVLLLSSIIIVFFIRSWPIRLPNMFFLLPADKHSQKHYICACFSVRLILLCIITYAFYQITLGCFFYEKTFPCILVQSLIYIFVVWNLLLKNGISQNYGHGSLEESHSLKDKIVNFYWIFFLMLQQILLGTGYIFEFYQTYPLAWIVWLLPLSINILIARQCTGHFLKKACVYQPLYLINKE